MHEHDLGLAHDLALIQRRQRARPIGHRAQRHPLVSNLANISFASDNVFSDGVTTQLLSRHA
jgi:hypothetical protein